MQQTRHTNAELIAMTLYVQQHKEEQHTLAAWQAALHSHIGRRPTPGAVKEALAAVGAVPVTPSRRKGAKRYARVEMLARIIAKMADAIGYELQPADRENLARIIRSEMPNYPSPNGTRQLFHIDKN